ncbi:MAG: TetR/AcrR family transcriptional regulator [Lachnospiraceae bacterium]|jgi:AcrR family transcriptional regulator|nr:TetR/AcrR family transcriptional regulator [Lachnospiraceae bacterium]MCX4315182.1 TetR/AcrR family transcriptional regulator [Lachnospiraceae bacterium]
MARNKYPEVTVEKILEVSQRLFLTKGYDNTTIQDIVEELGGLTRGAIYHHFKSKEEIMDALTRKMFFEKNPFEQVKKQTDLNGLQKMKLAIALNQSDKDAIDLSLQAIPILKNPRILVGMIESNRQQLSPCWLELLMEGIADGSIHTEYAKELSELIPLFDLWLTPSVYPATAEELHHKFLFIKELLNKMGLPLFDEEFLENITKTIAAMGDIQST